MNRLSTLVHYALLYPNAPVLSTHTETGSRLITNNLVERVKWGLGQSFLEDDQLCLRQLDYMKEEDKGELLLALDPDEGRYCTHLQIRLLKTGAAEITWTNTADWASIKEVHDRGLPEVVATWLRLRNYDIDRLGAAGIANYEMYEHEVKS